MFSATYKAGIYAWSDEPRDVWHRLDVYPPAIFIIPGMYVGCFPYDALIISNLECFFNWTCLNITAQLISNLPVSDWPKPLNALLSTRYLPNDTITNIYQQMMIDQWEIMKNFSSYYAACAPTQCTYTYTQRFDFLSLITILLSLFSGLTVALRIVSPFIVKLGHWLHTQFVKKYQQQISQQGIVENIPIKHFYYLLLNATILDLILDRVNTIPSISLVRTSTQDAIAQVATESIRLCYVIYFLTVCFLRRSSCSNQIHFNFYQN